MQEIMKTKFHNLLYFYDTRIVGWKGNIEIPAKCGITAANLLCI